ncbi:MAG: hypothetical protein P1U71_00035 [Sneathiella sp.]|nr:hypothetical protein [Sneathiella sp.]MDF2365627.1 hypothetical protein [Sneathiella sp.]
MASMPGREIRLPELSSWKTSITSMALYFAYSRQRVSCDPSPSPLTVCFVLETRQ